MFYYLPTFLFNFRDFGKMALGVLDISYTDASAQAYSMLSRPIPDFNNKSTIEIAYESNYLNFIAHPCCQKWLTSKLYGSIQVTELDWGICRLPYWFKVYFTVNNSILKYRTFGYCHGKVCSI